MRQRQTRLVKPQTVKIDKIDINSPWSVAYRPYTTKGIFDGMHAIRKFVDLQSGIEDCQLVEKLHMPKLCGDINRRGLFDIARLSQARFWHFGQHRDSPRKIFTTWLDIGT